MTTRPNTHPGPTRPDPSRVAEIAAEARQLGPGADGRPIRVGDLVRLPDGSYGTTLGRFDSSRPDLVRVEPCSERDPLDVPLNGLTVRDDSWWR